SMMWFRLVLLILLPFVCTHLLGKDKSDSSDESKEKEKRSTTKSAISVTTVVDSTTKSAISVTSVFDNTTEAIAPVNPVAISNPWLRADKLKGFGKVSYTSKSVVPRLFADMGRAGFPPINSVMKWPCWEGIDEESKDQFIEIFNENNTKRELKELLNEWILERNGTAIAEKMREFHEDFDGRMRLFSVNFESAMATLSTAVGTFNDVAMNDDMTIAESNAVINTIAELFDRNFVKSLYFLFNGNVMNGKKLQHIIAMKSTTTTKPFRKTFPPMMGNNTGNGVWIGNWKRYTKTRRVTARPVQTTQSPDSI
ncbi:hypothetical protein PFISCL1PPCAC_14660, partial [Pristionchus fissidentatus]